MRHEIAGKGVVTGLLSLGLAATLWSCGSKSKDDGGDDDAPAPEATTTPATETETTSGENPSQLGDETIGVKNGEQIVAHFSLMTGVKFADLTDANKDFINKTKLALPTDNAAGKFNPSHVLAATKVATVFCNAMLTREQTARTDPSSGITPVLPDLDWASTKFPKEIARPVYSDMTELLWGVDASRRPTDADATAALDELVDSFAQPVTVQGTPRTVNLRSAVLGICVTVAIAFPSLEI
jgi:hypothetical protein